MRKHAVEKHADPAFFARSEEAIEGSIVAQPRVDFQVVQRVVAVGFGLKNRAERDPVEAEFLHIVEPAGEVIEAPSGAGIALADRGVGEAEWVYVPPQGVIDPSHDYASFARRRALLKG